MNLNEAYLAALVARARTAVGQGIKYRLGHGGNHPEDPQPTRTGTCDCSGFIAWAIGTRRSPVPGKREFWIETTNIFNDATKAKTQFVKIPEAVPGCLVVYPDKNGKEGHIAVVTKVTGSTLMVIDCSSSQKGKTVESIREWNRKALFDNHGAIYCVHKDAVS